MAAFTKKVGLDFRMAEATGGLAGGLEKHSRHIKLVDPSLTLDGLRLIAEIN